MDNGRQHIAIGHLRDSGDLKILFKDIEYLHYVMLCMFPECKSEDLSKLIYLNSVL